MNLAVNARDAMPDGGTLTIETRTSTRRDARRTEAYGGRLRRCSTSPTPGIGMDADDAGARLRAVLHDEGRGQGHRARARDGATASSSRAAATSRLRREPGDGTTFRVFFPRRERCAAPRPSGAAEPLAGGAETVLLVEDEERSASSSGHCSCAAATPSSTRAPGRRRSSCCAHHEGEIDLAAHGRRHAGDERADAGADRS